MEFTDGSWRNFSLPASLTLLSSLPSLAVSGEALAVQHGPALVPLFALRHSRLNPFESQILTGTPAGIAMYEVQATASTFQMIGQEEDNARLLAAEPSSEAVLVKAVLEGDREQFARLYDLYARMVHGILLARVPRDEVDDLVQDIFLHALKKLHTLRNAAAFGSWLSMIARNRAIDFHRNSRATVQLEDDAPGSPGPEAQGTLAGQILEMIRGLPDAYRETLVLRLVEGMTGPEIAERTGMTPASVRVNLHRGMKLLRTKLGFREGL